MPWKGSGVVVHALTVPWTLYTLTELGPSAMTGEGVDEGVNFRCSLKSLVFAKGNHSDWV